MALVMLFLALVVGCALYVLIWAFDRRRFRLEAMKHLLNSFIMTGLVLAGRILAGFAHAYIDDGMNRAVLLLVASAFSLFATIRFACAFIYKRSFWISICGLAIKSLLNVVFLVELWV